MSDTNLQNSSGPLRVLVADDDPVFRELVCARLGGLACECEQAEDGIVAWHAIMSNSFDMAIVDLSMPNLDGYELLRCVRNHPRTKHMPIVVITSSTEKEAIEEALTSGATSFLTKPLNWTTFSSHVKYLMRLSQSANAARRMVRQSEATSRAKEAVLGNVLTEASDHARKILSEVSSLADVAAGDQVNTLTPDVLERFARVGQDLQSVVDKANYIANIIPAAVSVEDELINLDRIIQDLREVTSTTAAAHDVELIFARSMEDPALRCDKGGITEALTQLVVNAITHSRSGQAIQIRYQILPDDALEISVTDTGAGMTPEQAARAQSPLTYADQPKNSECGHIGLGLPIASAIAEAHGGRLELQSTPGQGTTAKLILPPERIVMPDAYAASA